MCTRCVPGVHWGVQQVCSATLPNCLKIEIKKRLKTDGQIIIFNNTVSKAKHIKNLRKIKEIIILSINWPISDLNDDETHSLFILC